MLVNVQIPLWSMNTLFCGFWPRNRACSDSSMVDEYAHVSASG